MANKFTRRIQLSSKYAKAVDHAAEANGVSQAEIVRMALRHYWGESLQFAPINQSNSQN